MGSPGSDVVGREEDVAALVEFLDARRTCPPSCCSRATRASARRRSGAAASNSHRRRSTGCSRAGRPARGAAVIRGSRRPAGDALEEVLPAPPAPQAKALAVALLVEEARGPPRISGRSRSPSWGAASARAVDSRCVVAIDDLQWLDRPSAFVLQFALRRLRAEHVGFLLTLRQAEESPTALERAPCRGPAPAPACRPAERSVRFTGS